MGSGLSLALGCGVRHGAPGVAASQLGHVPVVAPQGDSLAVLVRLHVFSSPDTSSGSRLGPRVARRSAWPHPDTVPHSFRATSGPVIRLRSGNVEAMIASEATSPPTTVAQYVIPGMLNAMPTWERR